tara:strand:- start:236 stop:826 length:591 start_codon:yes stop_codon:yes gene_type:complete
MNFENVKRVEKFSDFVYFIDDVLTESFCKQVIDKFETDERQEDGIFRINGQNKLIPELKKCKEIYISEKSDWKDEDDVFYNSLSKNLESYYDYCRQYFSGLFNYNTNDSGYNIKKYNADDDYYHWHHDGGDKRHILCIWYLNDNFEDGETELIDGTKIQPKTGRLVFIPATWNYIHRGIQPKNGNKYIVTTWIQSK